MAKDNSFEKASAKLLGSFGSGVTIAQPSGGRRMDSRERERERERLEKDAAGEGESPSVPVAGEGAPATGGELRGRGRPRSADAPVNPVLMNFKVEADFRQRVRVLAADEGVSISSLFYEAFDLLFEKRRSGR